jgi:hypothetical protein
MALAEELRQDWQLRLQADCPDQPSSARESIVRWLLGDDPDHFDQLLPEQIAIAKQAIDYRYRILQERYLRVGPEQAYRQLIQRLSSLFLIRSKIRTWVALSRDRRRSVMDVLQEVIQELIQGDSYIRQQVSWIGQCTTNPRLRNALLLTSIEEYCLRPIRNQPLLVYRFVNYLRRSQRGGMTQVPAGDLVRLVSEEITQDDMDSSVSLLDTQAITQYQDEQAWEEQQSVRHSVKQEFVGYLEKEVDPVAARWLELYLQGKSQEAIAQALGMPIKQVYRLREKISYHAIRVFTLKVQPDLVMGWLGTSLREHRLGLTLEQWQQFWDGLTADQQQLLEYLKAGRSIEAIARDLNLKAHQVTGEWIRLYLAAQALRTES